MATFTGRTIANTYKGLLNIDNNNSGIDGTVRTVQDGEGTNSPLQLSNSILNVNGAFQIGGVQLTANVSSLNALADITGATGMIAVDGGTAYGRTLTGGAGVSITNANGTSGNPTIALNTTGVSAATYGPVSFITVNSVGQVTSATIPTSISVAEIKGSTFTTEYLNASANVSITGDTFVGGGLTVSGTTSVSNIVVTSIDAGQINSAIVSCSIMTANVLNVIGFGTSVTNFTANNLVVVSSTQITGMVSAANAVFSGNVSAANLYADTNIYIAGVAIPNASQITSVNDSITALSATMATSIGTANTRITSVSDFAVALSATLATSIGTVNTRITSVSDYAVALSATLATSISNSNSAITALSATMATSIGTANTRITSVSDFAVALSATLATSIGTANTRITSVSDFAVALSATLATSIGTANTRITSVSDFAVALSATMATSISNSNSAITALSATMATSISNSNSAITALSATMATSIGTANTRITSVSDYAVALSATLATSVASRLPLAGGTITGTVSAQEVDVSSLGIGTVAGAKRLTMNGAAVAQYASLTDGATIAVNFNTAQNFIIQLAGNRTLENPTNCVAGQTGSIVIVQDGTGGRTLSYGTSWNFIGGTAPTLSTGVSAVDRIDYIVYTSTAVQAIASLDIK
jgi:trimeric autotransporter adhesin